MARLPYHSPVASLGHRTTPTCPTSSPPRNGSTLFPPAGPCTTAACPLPASTPSLCNRTPPSRHLRFLRVSCSALHFAADLPQSHVLPAIVTSVFESNITAASCFAAYPAGRMHAAPPLVGRADGHPPHHHLHQHHHYHAQAHAAPALGSGALQARTSVVAHSHQHHSHVMAAAMTHGSLPHASTAASPPSASNDNDSVLAAIKSDVLVVNTASSSGSSSPLGNVIISSTPLGGGADQVMALVDEDVFGLATCLATPLDPGAGALEGPLQGRLLAPLPATTTTIARTAASVQQQLSSSSSSSEEDLLQAVSRYGDWVRRQQRRRRLEQLQGVLAELGDRAVLGRLLPPAEGHQGQGTGWERLGDKHQQQRRRPPARWDTGTCSAVGHRYRYRYLQRRSLGRCWVAVSGVRWRAVSVEEEGEPQLRLTSFRDDVDLATR